VDIPYPFGIGEQCAIHKSFALSCNISSTGTGGGVTPFIGDLPVTRVFVQEHKVWIKSWISSRCHDPAGGGKMPYNTPSVNVTRWPYWFSDTDNKVFVIGCNTVGIVRVVGYTRGVSVSAINNQLLLYLVDV
jgi:hypothetical protein